jgi:hypothetical protein
MAKAKRHVWTDEDLGVIADTLDIPAAEVARRLDTTTAHVHVYRRKVRSGWTNKQPDWAEAEKAILTSASPYSTAADLAKELPGRSERSIASQRVRMGLRSIPAAHKIAHLTGGRPLIAKTCRGCGLLLPAGWFVWNQKRRIWSGDCKRCRSDERLEAYHGGDKDLWQRPNREAQRKSLDIHQAVSLPSASRNGYGYEEKDHTVLSDPDLTLLEKALKLNRTFLAVRSAVVKFGYKSHSGLGDPERDAWMIDNPNAERIDEIREALNATPELVSAGKPAWDWDD